MDELRERFIGNALAMYDRPHRLPLLRLVRRERPLLVMPRERPLAAGDWGLLGKRLRVDSLGLWERGTTWN